MTHSLWWIGTCWPNRSLSELAQGFCLGQGGRQEEHCGVVGQYPVEGQYCLEWPHNFWRVIILSLNLMSNLGWGHCSSVFQLILSSEDWHEGLLSNHLSFCLGYELWWQKSWRTGLNLASKRVWSFEGSDLHKPPPSPDKRLPNVIKHPVWELFIETTSQNFSSYLSSRIILNIGGLIF